MKRTITAALISVALGSVSLSASANNNDWGDESRDAWIHGSAQTTLMLNTNLNAFDISSEVNDGVVTLRGEVETSVDRSLAEELVEDIDGVNRVNNELTVRHDYDENDENGVGATLNDGRIFTVVKTRLLFNGDVSGTDVEVEVDNGVVTLSGRVDSDSERDLAEQIASNTNGVESVRNNLRVAARN